MKELVTLLRDINDNFVEKIRSQEIVKDSFDLQDVELIMDIINKPLYGIAITQAGLRDYRNGSEQFREAMDMLLDGIDVTKGCNEPIDLPESIRKSIEIQVLTSYAKYYLLKGDIEHAFEFSKKAVQEAEIFQFSSINVSAPNTENDGTVGEYFGNVNVYTRASHALYIKTLSEYKLGLIQGACKTVICAIKAASCEQLWAFAALDEREKILLKQSQSVNKVTTKMKEYWSKTVSLADVYALSGELYAEMGEHALALESFNRSLELLNPIRHASSPVEQQASEVEEKIGNSTKQLERLAVQKREPSLQKKRSKRRLKKISSRGKKMQPDRRDGSNGLSPLSNPLNKGKLSTETVGALQKPFGGNLEAEKRVEKKNDTQGLAEINESKKVDTADGTPTSDSDNDKAKEMSRLAMATSLLLKWRRGETPKYDLEDNELEKFMRGEITTTRRQGRRRSQASALSSEQHSGKSRSYQHREGSDFPSEGGSDIPSRGPGTEEGDDQWDYFEEDHEGESPITSDERSLASGTIATETVSSSRHTNCFATKTISTHDEENSYTSDADGAASENYDYGGMTPSPGTHDHSHNDEHGSPGSRDFTTGHSLELEEQEENPMFSWQDERSPEGSDDYTHDDFNEFAADHEEQVEDRATASNEQVNEQDASVSHESTDVEQGQECPAQQGPKEGQSGMEPTTTENTSNDKLDDHEEILKQRRTKRRASMIDTFLFSEDAFPSYDDDDGEEEEDDDELNESVKNEKRSKKASSSRMSMSLSSPTGGGTFDFFRDKTGETGNAGGDTPSGNSAGRTTLRRRLFINSLLRQSITSTIGNSKEGYAEPKDFFLDCLVRAVRLVSLIFRLRQYVRRFRERKNNSG